MKSTRRAHRLNVRGVDTLDRRLARDDACSSPFVRVAHSAPRDGESLVDALLEGRLEAPEPTNAPSPRPREAGSCLAARANDAINRLFPRSRPRALLERAAA